MGVLVWRERKGFCCKHVECEQAAERNADKQLEMWALLAVLRLVYSALR